ncbi:MAG TPA: hypothetical protein PL133_05395 [Methylophilaceae bacterium]|nr:hypothetical protein [Methylophilaceae bacterium]
MKHHSNPKFNQRGASLIVLVLVLVLGGLAVVFSSLDGQSIRAERDNKTHEALSEAKLALIGYATRSGLATGAARPGELPCPDANNDGSSDVCAVNALGRLPWRTLGINDLRDGDGERLWYAVSTTFKNNPRIYPLNSDTLGTITLRDAAGSLLYNGSANNGLVAVIVSPGAPMTRQDGVHQVRDVANINNAINYLDIALGEDNQNFLNGNLNGFVLGPIKDATGDIILNDKIVSISRHEIMIPVERRVAATVINALLDYFCGSGNVNYDTNTCLAAGGPRSYPHPANFADSTCLGIGNLAAGCASDLTVNHGRLPANPNLSWDTASLLLGSNGNWFQRNGWREQVHYAVAPACVIGTTDCDGLGFQTLNISLLNTVDANLIVAVGGEALTGQSRASVADKLNEANYLEDENLTTADDVYTNLSLMGNPFNDRVVSLP